METTNKIFYIPPMPPPPKYPARTRTLATRAIINTAQIIAYERRTIFVLFRYSFIYYFFSVEISFWNEKENILMSVLLSSFRTLYVPLVNEETRMNVTIDIAQLFIVIPHEKTKFA